MATHGPERITVLLPAASNRTGSTPCGTALMAVFALHRKPCSSVVCHMLQITAGSAPIIEVVVLHEDLCLLAQAAGARLLAIERLRRHELHLQALQSTRNTVIDETDPARGIGAAAEQEECAQRGSGRGSPVPSSFERPSQGAGPRAGRLATRLLYAGTAGVQQIRGANVPARLTCERWVSRSCNCAAGSLQSDRSGCATLQITDGIYNLDQNVSRMQRCMSKGSKHHLAGIWCGAEAGSAAIGVTRPATCIFDATSIGNRKEKLFFGRVVATLQFGANARQQSVTTSACEGQQSRAQRQHPLGTEPTSTGWVRSTQHSFGQHSQHGVGDASTRTIDHQ